MQNHAAIPPPLWGQLSSSCFQTKHKHGRKVATLEGRKGHALLCVFLYWFNGVYSLSFLRLQVAKTFWSACGWLFAFTFPQHSTSSSTARPAGPALHPPSRAGTVTQTNFCTARALPCEPCRPHLPHAAHRQPLPGPELQPWGGALSSEGGLLLLQPQRGEPRAGPPGGACGGSLRHGRGSPGGPRAPPRPSGGPPRSLPAARGPAPLRSAPEGPPRTGALRRREGGDGGTEPRAARRAQARASPRTWSRFSSLPLSSVSESMRTRPFRFFTMAVPAAPLPPALPPRQRRRRRRRRGPWSGPACPAPPARPGHKGHGACAARRGGKRGGAAEGR